MACKRKVKNTGDKRYGGPEYETLAALGSVCGVGDLDAVCRGHELCNAMGIDTIGAEVQPWPLPWNFAKRAF